MADICTNFCTICIDNVKGEEVKRLNCGHVFHISCIDAWIKKRCICPNCSKPISEIQWFPLSTQGPIQGPCIFKYVFQWEDSGANRQYNALSVIQQGIIIVEREIQQQHQQRDSGGRARRGTRAFNAKYLQEMELMRSFMQKQIEILTTGVGVCV